MGDIIWVLVPVTALLIPIVAIFSHHQQKMAQIIHGRQDPEEVAALRAQVEEMRRQLASQSVVLDDIRSQVKGLPSATIQDRLGS